MAINYAKMHATAIRLISENGVTAKLSRIDPGTYDPLLDTDNPTTLEWSTKIVLIPVKPGELRPDMSMIPEKLITANISYGLISDLPDDVQPVPTDTLLVEGTGIGAGLWIVRGSTPVQPASNALLHNCLLERAGGYGGYAR